METHKVIIDVFLVQRYTVRELLLSPVSFEYGIRCDVASERYKMISMGSFDFPFVGAFSLIKLRDQAKWISSLSVHWILHARKPNIY